MKVSKRSKSLIFVIRQKPDLEAKYIFYVIIVICTLRKLPRILKAV